MTGDHERIEELLAVRALGGLDGDDVAALDRMLAAHGDCATCRELEAEATATASALAMALDPLEVDPAMPDRIIASDEEVVAVPAAERQRGRWLPTIAVAAAIVIAVGSLAVIRNRPATEPGAPAQRVITFAGSDTATLAMAFVPGEPGAIFWGEGLPDPDEGQTYEIWMIEDGTPVSGGCVTPIDGRIALVVDADVSTAEEVAVTLEPSSCPGAPTGEVVLSATL